MDENEEKSKRSTLLVSLAIVSFIALVLFGASQYYPQDSKVYGVNNYYKPTKSTSNVDQRELYNQIHKNVVASAMMCNKTIQSCTSTNMINGYYWIVDGSLPPSNVSELTSMLVDSQSNVLRPYSEGDSIVAPGQLTFRNANTTEYDDGKIRIEVYIGQDYVIRWDDVAAWWCHIGKEDPTKHTEQIGLGGLYSTCAGGYVIGKAKETTEVHLFKVQRNSGGASGESLSACSWSEFLGLSDSNP